jgi:hypothetical protein
MFNNDGLETTANDDIWWSFGASRSPVWVVGHVGLMAVAVLVVVGCVLVLIHTRISLIRKQNS